jgi:hypothetical protein
MSTTQFQAKQAPNFIILILYIITGSFGNMGAIDILASNITDTLQLELVTVASITHLFTITGNSLTANYTAAVAAVSNGVTNTAAIPVRVEQLSLFTWTAFISAGNTLATGINTATYSLVYDIVGGATGNFNGDNGGGTIDTATELAYVR